MGGGGTKQSHARVSTLFSSVTHAAKKITKTTRFILSSSEYERLHCLKNGVGVESCGLRKSVATGTCGKRPAFVVRLEVIEFFCLKS
jgi:hypothetical protein